MIKSRATAFTLIELLATIAIAAILTVSAIVFIGNYVAWSRQTADKQTLLVLNDAITRYKTEGGDITALTEGKAMNHLVTALGTPVAWNGVTHQFLRSSGEIESRALTIAATGDGRTYRLTQFNSYTDGTGTSVAAPPAEPIGTNWEVTSLAGSATWGSTDGTGEAASFWNPYGLCVDGSGNVFVADTDGNLIRKVTPAGVVTTFAGSARGYADGTGSAAMFYYPCGVTFGGDGTLFVADTYNKRIRKISPSAEVTFLAGSGIGAWGDGTGAAAHFENPVALVVGGSGNVYVADYGNNCIRKITPAGVVTTLVNGISMPHYMAIDGSENLYVTDRGTHCIRKITPSGVVTLLAGSGSAGYADGTGSAASFNDPCGIAMDGNGSFYVADRVNNCIRKVTAAGVVTTVAGSGNPTYADGIGAAASFYWPTAVCIDSNWTIYVADSNNQRIRKMVWK